MQTYKYKNKEYTLTNVTGLLKCKKDLENNLNKKVIIMLDMDKVINPNNKEYNVGILVKSGFYHCILKVYDGDSLYDYILIQHITIKAYAIID